MFGTKNDFGYNFVQLIAQLAFFPNFKNFGRYMDADGESVRGCIY